MADGPAASVAEIAERTRLECAELERSSGLGPAASLLGAADFDYGDVEAASDEEADGAEARPAVVLMGLKRSGKTSIRKVVFQKMSPNETLFVESTVRVTSDRVTSSFVDFDTFEYPGQVSPFDASTEPLCRAGALVFVIDAMEDYNEALKRLCDYVVRAHKLNAAMRFEVFVHKVDGLTDDQKMDIQRDIYQRANDDLVDLGYDNIHLSFHLTSIYDHSIFEAFSKVVQKLIPQLPALEQLLDIFNQNSHVEKSFLFDVSSKIYVATDNTPVSMEVYELCCDMIDVAVDIACIYGLADERNAEADGDERPASGRGDEPAAAGAGLGGSLSATIKLHNRVDDAAPLNAAQVLYLRQVNEYLALVCIGRAQNMDKQGLIDYNFKCFRDAIAAVFEVRRKMLLTARRRQRDARLARRRARAKASNASSSTGGGGARQLQRLRHASRDTAESTASS